MSGKHKQERTKQIRIASMAIMIPMIMLVSPIVGYLIGDLLDDLFNINFLGFVFLVLGFVAGIKESYEIIKKISR